MLPRNVWLRTEWLSTRKNSVLRCVERYSAAADREYRRALRKMQEVEEPMVQAEKMPLHPSAAMQSGEVEALNRRLAAANAEIRRYQTRLFALEREMVALRQENAELEALCDQARRNGLLPPRTPQPPVLDQPGLPVIVFPGEAAQHPEQQPEGPAEEASPAADAPQEPTPAPPERTAAVTLRMEPDPEERPIPFETADWKPTTQLDYLSLDIVHRLEEMMG